jgi:magnesium-transporting ATPase (P-type)
VLCPGLLKQISEAMLTGESVPSSKAVPAVAPAAPLGDRKCMCYRCVSTLGVDCPRTKVVHFGPFVTGVHSTELAAAEVLMIRLLKPRS